MPRDFCLLVCVFVCGFAAAHGQTIDATPDAVRVTVTMNTDGSRTTYRWDTANHAAVATTTLGGKLREKIRYTLDDAGRFATGEVFGPKETLRFTTRYKYDSAGRLSEESQFAKDGALQNRIVYAFDSSGRPIGYSVFDRNSRLVGQTAPGRSLPREAKESKKASSP